jgi:hypothetical protein
MQGTDEIFWTTDKDLFLALDGAKQVVDCFGYMHDFHDATLSKLELSNGNAQIALNVCHMTDEVDGKGFFVLDRHALVTIHLTGVTGVSLTGAADSIVEQLNIRRVEADHNVGRTVAGPVPGNFEVRWESAWGLEGAIFAREVRFELVPTAA